MYISDHDPQRSLAVWVFDSATPAEWEVHFQHLRELTTWSTRTGQRAAVLFINKSFDMPSTELRAQLTDLTGRPGYDPYVAFVTPNKTMMTVLTLFSWFQKKPRYETRFVSNVEAGLAWLEEKRGGPLNALREMVRQAQHRTEEAVDRATA
jgi:hypothetical protein